jgi:SNF2 family DNA or RNA helicase
MLALRHIDFYSSAAGAAGLNLMVANHCFLMDPAMNSAVEEQAIDR